jgi:hypothetical protein
MNTTKSVYNRLFKEEDTELASHKVELAGLDDIVAAETAPNQFMDKAIAAKKEAMTNFVEAQRKYKAVVELCDKYLPMAKELGDANTVRTLTNKRKMANDMFKALNLDITKLK